MNSLADLISEKRDEIVQAFADRLYQSSASVALPREEVIDSLREFLDELAASIRADGDRDSQTTSARSIATEHGGQRFHSGFDLAAVIREYGSLRDIIYETIERSQLVFDTRELRVLSKYLINGIADAATKFGIERDEALRRRAAEHIGFLAHELRNPLSSARLALSMLKSRGELRPGRSLEVLERGLERVGRLIDQSLIEMRLRGGAALDLGTIALPEFLEALAEESAAEVEGKTLRLELEVQAGVQIRADARLLRSATSNLIRNAVKFSHEGGRVVVRARAAAGRAIIEVEDECGGLPEGRQEDLFNPFVQSGQDRSGFGLGLAIAKQAVDAHQGGLQVHNLPGKGCVFVLDLPVSGPIRESGR